MTPVFSVVVPTYARPEHLSRCLESLGALEYPADSIEVVVVDDAASEKTAAQVSEAANRMACRVLYVSHGPRSGPARARNAGARLASGRYLAFTDDDCTPDRGWLTALEAVLSGGDRSLVGGSTINGLPELPCAVASQTLIDFLYDYHRDAKTPRRFFTSNNFAAPADTFREVGGFDETFPLAAGEDREFCERWLARGGRLVHAPEAVVMHWHRLDARRFVRQHFNYGRGAHFLQQSRSGGGEASRSSWPQREPLSFYTRMLRYPFATQRWPGAVVTSGLLAVSQTAYVAGYLYQRTR